MPMLFSYLHSGYQLRDKYTIKGVLGKGGFHISYRATDDLTGRELIISEYYPESFVEREMHDYPDVRPKSGMELAYQEMLNLSIQSAVPLIKLPYHPNLVQVISIFRDNNTVYKVMDDVMGTTLDHYVSTDTLTERELKPILYKILSAVNHLHANGLVHRDIKPGKIIIRPGGEPVLLGGITMYSMDSTEPAVIIGTPGYAPTEQMLPITPTPLMDIYALGATFYRIITDKHPEDAFSRTEDESLADCTELHERFSPELLSTIDKAFAVKPEDRWQSVQDWMNAL